MAKIIKVGKLDTATKIESIRILLFRLWHHLSSRRKNQFGLLFGLILISALAEVISLGAVLPFLGVLTSPEKVFNYPIVASISRDFGINSAEDIVLPFTIIFCIAALVAGGIRLLLLWVSTRLAFASGADLNLDVYRRTLYQPYRVHASRNSSDIISGITVKTSSVVFGVLLPTLTLLSSLFMIVAIIVTLLFIDAGVAVMAVIGFGLSYVIVAWLSRRKLEMNSKRVARESTNSLKALQEGLGGIRDILLNSSQPIYCKVYHQADLLCRRAQGNVHFIGGSPRFIMEVVGMILIAILAYSISKSGGIATALPTLGALALGAQRILPSLQQGYASWASIKGSQAILSDTLDLLEQPLPDYIYKPFPKPLSFSEEINFKNVRFRYSDDTHWVLDDIDLHIPKNTRVGFIGSTGSGKSTMLDLLMGLLEVTEGNILVDGVSLNEGNRQAWQQTIAHVPQSIYLTDATISENIAFGIPQKDIDLEQVRKVAAQAQISDYIESCPEKYDTVVGERGIRISGGQRQRIGIARALYKQSSILVFDEATSALDNSTEQAVMDSIENLDRNITILLIAHRLTSVKNCDMIVELKGGKIVSKGTYDYMLKNNATFGRMVTSGA